MADTVRAVDAVERRARLGRRHGLVMASRAADPVGAAADVVALHATDPATVYLSAAVRMAQPSLDAVGAALYEDRTLVRMLGMRRTMFVVPVGTAAVVQHSSTDAIAATERRKLVRLLETAGIATDGNRWLADVEESTWQALVLRGEATATELADDEPRLRESVVMAAGKPYEARQNIVTRVLFVMAAEGRIVRTRPRGSWQSGQHRWAPMRSWLPAGPTEPAADPHAELVRLWLTRFGPGTTADIRWWTGWTAALVTRALRTVGAVGVHLDGGTGWLLPDDLEPVAAPEPWAALLPGLDPTVMGWSGRAWYLGEHGPALFDRSGNAGPTIWYDGRIVGGWAQRPDGEVVTRLLEDIGSAGREAVGDSAARTAALLGPARVTPRFRSPLERELSG